ncbi:MAG: Rrf2 family transcriptional regulator, partial [Verrucomicrobiota bacterium]
MTLIGQRFSSGERAPTAVEMAQIMEVPMQLICQIARVLLDAKLVVEVVGAETGYTPARPLEQISAHDILQALRMGHGQDAPPGPDDGGNRLRLEFETIHQAEKEVAASMTLKHLVERTQTKAEVS